MQYIIDRFEEDLAVCEAENGVMVDIPRADLPEEAREGDVLALSEGRFAIDTEMSRTRRERIREKMMRLFS